MQENAEKEPTLDLFQCRNLFLTWLMVLLLRVGGAPIVRMVDRRGAITSRILGRRVGRGRHSCMMRCIRGRS